MIASHWLQRVGRKRQGPKLPSRPIVRVRAYRPVVEELELRVLLDVGVNRPFVAQAYRDVLQREGAMTELASWSNLLDQGTTRAQVTRLIETSPEYQALVVKGLFSTILHRAADASGLDAYVSFMSKGGTAEQVEALLAGSPEYFQSRGSGTNAGFLTALYQDVLGRPIDPAGQATFTQALANGSSPSDVATVLLNSSEFRQNLVRGDYQRFLQRAADSGGLTSFVTMLQNGARDEDLIAVLVGSSEYYSTRVDPHGSPNQIFVVQLYLDVLGRPVDTIGETSWTAYLDQGGSRAQMARQIENSAEYQTIVVTRLFNTVLHRSTDPAGLNTFVAFLSQGGTAEQVEANLAGSTEYFQSRSGGTNDGFLAAVYQDLLGRPIDAGGMATFTQALANGTTRTQVATVLLSSTEFRQNLVQSLYQGYLHRAADSGGLSGFVTTLQNGARDEDVAAQLIGSVEYLVRAVNAVSPMTTASALSASGFPSPTTAGTPANITVAAKDINGNVVTGYRGTVHFTSSDSRASLPADYAFTSSDQGVHIFTATLKTVGSQSLTATDTMTAVTVTQSGIAVSPAAASTLSVSGFPSPVQAGTAGTFTVTAADPYGNIATGYNGTIHFASNDGQAILPADYTFTSGDRGTHTFTATLRTAGNLALRATDTALPTVTGTQVGITVTGTLSVVGFPSPTMAGATGSLTVTAKDANGNLLTAYRGTVHFSSSDAQASLPTDYTFTSADGGTHTFSASLKTAGSQWLAATDLTTPTIAATETGIAVNPAGTSALTANSFPATVPAGTASSFVVTAVDAYGNTVTGYTGTVGFVSSSQSATLPSAYTFTSSDNGRHTFSAALNMTGTQSLTAIDTTTGGLVGVQSGIAITRVAGTTYYVSPTGSDNNPGTLTLPFLTINHGASILHPGDTLYLRAGTYAESLVNAVPSGTSWSQSVKISAYPGETVTLLPPASTNSVLQFQFNAAYIEVDNLILDAINLNAPVVWIDSAYAVGTPNHIRLYGCELRNSNNPSQAQGLLMTCQKTAGSRVANNNEFINLKIHDIVASGTSFYNHGMYIEGSYNLIDGCEVYNTAAMGIQIWATGGTNGTDSSYNTVRNCKIHDSGKYDLVNNHHDTAGLLIAVGDGNVVYNNVLWNNTVHIYMETGATNTKVYNNTLNATYSNGQPGLQIYGVSGTDVENNIVANSSYSADILNAGSSGTILKNNLVTQTIMDTGTGTTQSGNIVNTNPLFVNAAGNDYHLQVGSSAIDAGVTLTSVLMDFDGIIRRHGSAYDIGAFEYH